MTWKRMYSYLSIKTTRHTDDETGKDIIRYTPVFTPPAPTARGTIRFSFWERWADDSIFDLDDARTEALKNAEKVIRSWFKED